jgi:kynureninase
MPLEAATVSESELLSRRDEFPILETSTYLISNSLGAMPRSVPDALAAYAESWEVQGVRAWEGDWWTMPDRVASAVATIIGAEAGTVSMHQNVTLASAVVASCFDFSGARNGIVCSELNFPSIVQMYRGQERNGAAVTLVPSSDGFTVSTEAMLAAIDESTLLVPISHVIFRSSYVQDVEAIVRRAHEVGALVVLDVYQSAGTLPLDVSALGVDFAVGGTLKWLCGGPGVAYMYASPEMIGRVEPALTGWFARANPFAFDPRDQSYRDDAWRFASGTTNIPSLSAALPGAEILAGLDLHAVRAKSVRQTQMLIECCLENGWQVNSPLDPALRAGHVTVDMPGAEDVARELLERRVMIDYRTGAGIRMAPHFYTLDEEVLAAVAAIREIVGVQ